MGSDIHIRHVMFYTPRKPAGNLMLVELDDGQYCILQDDKHTDGHCWPSEQRVAAVSAYDTMRQKLKAQENPPPPRQNDAAAGQ